MLDLVQLVRGQEDRSPRCTFADQVEHVLLAERVEPAGRLVEDEELGIVHERCDHAHLLLVALGEVAQAPPEVELEPLGKLVDGTPVDAAAQPAEKGEVADRGASRGRFELTRQIARQLPVSTLRSCASRPRISARPRVGRIRSSRRRMVVVFPAPFGPR